MYWLKLLVPSFRGLALFIGAHTALSPGPAAAQACLNGLVGAASDVCVVDPTDMSGLAADRATIALDRPSRREPRDAAIPANQAFPLGIAMLEIDGAAPSGGPVLDLVMVDAAGIWVMPNNAPLPSQLTISDDFGNAYLAISMAELLDECTTHSPPCSFTPPTVTAAFLETGDFDGDGTLDLAVYIQTDANPSGPEGTLVYLQVAPSGGLEILLRHPSIGRDAVDMAVADFDHDGRDDVALLFEHSVEAVLCGGILACTTWSAIDLKKPVALTVADFDNDGDKDLVVVGGGDETDTFYLWLSRNVGTAFATGAELTLPLIAGDVVTDVAPHNAFS